MTLLKFLEGLSLKEDEDVEKYSKMLITALSKSSKAQCLDNVVLSHREIDKTSPIELYEKISHEYNYE